MTVPTDELSRMRKQGSDMAIQLAVQSRWEEAASVNQQLVEMFPRDTEAWNRLGKALSELGRYEEAREAYGRTVELDPVNQIAKKNLQRLSTLGPGKERPAPAKRLEPQLFIEETGKTGYTNLANADAERLSVMSVGEQIDLRAGGGTLSAFTLAGERIGDIEPKLGLRLMRLMEGGNQYAAGLAANDGSGRVIIKETFQHPSQVGRVSFPAAGVADGFRSYTKESLLRYDLDDEEGRGPSQRGDEWAETVDSETPSRDPGAEIEGEDRVVPLYAVVDPDEGESDEDA